MSTLNNSRLLEVLACPRDGSALHPQVDTLECEQGHRFAVERGIPVFTENVRREALPENMAPAPLSNRSETIDPFVDHWLVNTHGNLYWGARGRLRLYPIPHWPLREDGQGRVLVDVGCSWGRWSIAAARAGFRPVGVDVHFDALEAGGRVTRQLAVAADFLCASADQLPFRLASVDFLFSYSVLQHLDRVKVLQFFREVGRILKPKGICLVQLPNKLGPYNLVRQIRRGFRDATPGTFEMRYWSQRQICQAIEETGLSGLEFRADGFFSQNPQLADLDLFSLTGKLVVLTSYAGCKAAALLPVLTRLADSLWVETRKA
jgi:SAM-dependent methyltransferase/uncharacterized protein YbaR (Trm112 family)